MIEYTPGPWKVTGYKNLIVNDSKGVTLCLHPQGKSLEQTQANARLIAAAPDLYEALERLYNGACDRGETINEEIGEEYDDWKICRLALEKAETGVHYKNTYV